ncbi:MAG: SUMF1/EgtB/PvdO family nonheme iron enzyme [Caldilineae bacterium]|nr:SUMF1/EgtB/PvdO family nonheme iron enzyme [Caldilineae bacterium]
MTADQSYPPILDDLPAPEDRLGFQPYVLALSDILLAPDTHTPLTLGLFGRWGSGKTSLMLQLQRTVETGGKPGQASRYRTVWFNAWKYNQEDALWRALLLVLLDDLEHLLKEDPPAKPKKGEPAPSPTAEELLDLLREALYHETAWSEQGERSINWTQALTAGAGIGLNLALSLLGPGLAAAGVAADTLQEARKELGKGAPVSQVGKLAEAFRREEIVHYQAQLRSLEQFQQNFALLVKMLLWPDAKTPRRLVVFVDDLDRCLPEKAIEVLEALKLFLDVAGCIFVLALDSEAIENAVRRRYQGEVKAREYLEKIVQVPFVLPPIEAGPMRAYVQSLAPALPDPRCAEVFAVGLGANPRQVKRILNIFLLLSRLVERRPELKGAIQPVRLAKIVAIQHAYRELYDLVKLTPGYLSDLDAHFRENKRGGRLGEEGATRPALPEALATFASRSDLERLFLCVADEDAAFAGQKPEALRPYITLTRQAAPVEAPAVHVARLAFEPEMVAAPSGPFLMGTSPEQVQALVQRYDWARQAQKDGWFEREQPQHEVTLGAFEIGRYPVLNVEYAEFVRAASAGAPSHWPGGSLPEELADHPVVNVSLQDALAYVQWLAERTGKPYRLPSEAEWEKAARGDDGRLWPWGNDWDAALANCKPAGPGRTSARGQYSPGGDSPCGAADMAGNVWEWCSSLWGKRADKPDFGYPYRPDDGRDNLTGSGLRILRGGAFYGDNPAIVRCACRYRLLPVNWNDGLGFRVARGPLK